MDGLHDIGGMDGFGSPRMEPSEPVFHHRWEARVFGMVALLSAGGAFVADAFRHAVERHSAGDYLRRGYYGRWLYAIERVLLLNGVITPQEIAARDPAGEPPAVAPTSPPLAPAPPAPVLTSLRAIDGEPRFGPGRSVRVRNLHPSGHTRLPRYVRGRCGVIERVYPAWVLPDTHAHGQGEDPQYVYAVRFTGRELWGPTAEAGISVCVDLFESYLAEGGAS